LAAGLGIFATIIARNFSPTSPRAIWLAVAVGGLGGLAHELAQSRGTVLIVERTADGISLGTIAGIILGGVAGPALKGVTEAADGQPGRQAASG